MCDSRLYFTFDWLKHFGSLYDINPSYRPQNMLPQPSSQKLIDFLNESKVKPSKSKRMFFSKKKNHMNRHQPIVVEPKKYRPLELNLKNQNTSVLALLKKEYSSSKDMEYLYTKDSMISNTDSLVSESTTASFESSLVSGMRLPSYPSLRSSGDSSNLELFRNSDDKKVDDVLGKVLDESSSTSSISNSSSSSSVSQVQPAAPAPMEHLTSKVSMQFKDVDADRLPLSQKKSVQFSGVDVITSQRDPSKPSSLKEKIKKFEGYSTTDSDESERIKHRESEDWSTSRTTQTEYVATESTENLSNEELSEQLRLMKLENDDMNTRLHALVDENSNYVKQNNTIKLQLEQVNSQKEHLQNEYTMMKSDFTSFQSHLLDSRSQLQISKKKTRELEKLSKKAIHKIKELESENKFLNMQVEWLRNKMSLSNEIGDGENSSSFASSISSMGLDRISATNHSARNSKARPSKNKKRKDSDHEDGWETEV